MTLIPDGVLLFVLMLLLPGLCLAQAPKVRRLLASGNLPPTSQLYGSTILTQWAITAALGLVWVFNGRSLAYLGVRLPGHGDFWLACITALIVAFALFMVSKHILRDQQRRAWLLTNVPTTVLGLLPRHAGQWPLFLAVAISAGVCEEFLYRGLGLVLLRDQGVEIWAALTISSVCFGLMHAYQGISGILSTALIGLFLGVLSLWAHSLIPAMLLHTYYDWQIARLITQAQNID